MTCSGIVIFDENINPVYIGHISTEDIKFKKNFEYGTRLKFIADNLSKLKEKYPPEKVVIERTFNRFNISTAVLYRVHGVASYIFNDVEQIYYAPKEIKAAILNGKATKKQIQDEIKKRYPNVKFNEIKLKKYKKKEESKDESDAFSIGLTYFIKNNLLK